METMTLEVTTFLFGSGTARSTPPAFVELAGRSLSARALIEQHVRAEVARADAARQSSLALHYMLSDGARLAPTPTALDADTEVARAHAALAERRYVLVVDGDAIHDLDATLSLSDRSHVCFVRLLPMIGG